MLCEWNQKIGEYAVVKALRDFIHSVWYIALVAFLMVCANLFSLELPVFYLYFLFGLFIVLFDDDLKGIIPIACCAYMSISYENNPAMNVDSAAFYRPAFIIQLTLIIVIAAVFLLGRLISILLRDYRCGENKKLPALTFGFLALGLSFLLGGLFSEFYSFRSVFFGFAVIASLCGLYFFFYYGVDWKRTKKEYFAEVFTVIGLGLLIELFGIYVKSGILTNSELDRGVLITGWGMYNNVGCVLAMCLPAPLYLSARRKRGWIFTIIAVVLLVGLTLTQSRGSILFGVPIFLVCELIALIKSQKKERVYQFIVLGAALLLAIIVVAVFWDKLIELFSDMIEKTFSGDPSNARGPIYKQGWEHFLINPSFGVGFYECTAFRWGSLSEDAFLPPRYHNTLIQLIASGGIFALATYLFHRAQTLFLLFRRPTMEKTFMALGILALLLTSLVECHFFSFGPGLLYSSLLVCAEGRNLSNEGNLSRKVSKDERM